MVSRFTFVVALLELSVSFAFAGESPAATPATPSSLLPAQFAGWHIPGSIRSSKDPEVADYVNAALTKVFGLTEFDTVPYPSASGRQVPLQAVRSPAPIHA